MGARGPPTVILSVQTSAPRSRARRGVRHMEHELQNSDARLHDTRHRLESTFGGQSLSWRYQWGSEPFTWWKDFPGQWAPVSPWFPQKSTTRFLLCAACASATCGAAARL